MTNGCKIVLTALVVAMVLGTAAVRPAAAEDRLLCSDHTLSVTLTPGGADTFQVVGTLCSKGPVGGKTLQVLVHGFSYARFYWDFPYQTEHYSYVRAATDQGYATFNLDRIGIGESDHPDGNLVDLDANAFVLHQVVDALKAGRVASSEVGPMGNETTDPGPGSPGAMSLQSFEKVIVVGHSLGSLTAVKYAATFPGEAQGIILTGFLHDANWDFIDNVFVPKIYPATLDPRFAGQFPNFDYFTTLPGTRGDLFYHQPNVDPVVLAIDESRKETGTIGEFGTALTIIYDPVSFQIVGPVQVVLGEFDAIFCGNLVNCSDRTAVQEYEQGWYGPSACVETEVIGASGHDLNLQTNAQAAYAKMLSWADRNVGSTAGAAPQSCGTP